MLQATDVTFTYRHPTRRIRPTDSERDVLHGVSIDVGRGELVGILGPNGSGKTTLLKVLGGALTPRSGSVTLDSRPLAESTRRQIARRVAYVPQDMHVPFDFSVLDVVLMGRFPLLGAFTL